MDDGFQFRGGQARDRSETYANQDGAMLSVNAKSESNVLTEAEKRAMIMGPMANKPKKATIKFEEASLREEKEKEEKEERAKRIAIRKAENAERLRQEEEASRLLDEK